MSKRFKKLSHSIYECKYHIIFCPKYRHRIFDGEIAEYTRQQIYQLLRQKDSVEVLELNIQPDHIHIVIEIAPKYAISMLMGYLKGKLSYSLFGRYERLGRRYWGRHLWSRGYCVTTVGIDEEMVRQYVRWQEKQEKRAEAIQQRLFD
jgi:putative transposase